MNPRVTIVTPSFNQAAFLERTIESVLSQDYPDLEYIVIDGNSNDGSVEIIRRYAKHLASWESNPDSGPAAAINRGFQRATGEVLAYLNSDDVYEPGAVGRAVEALAASAEIGIVYGDIRFIDERGRPTTFPKKRVTVYRASPFFPHALYCGAMFIPQQASFWRRSVYEKVGPMREDNCTCWDHEFFVHAALGHIRFQRIPAILAAFRIHQKSISSENRWPERRARDHARIAAFVAERHKISPLAATAWRFWIRLLRAGRTIFPWM